MTTDEPVALNSSALGTRNYWDEAYQRELLNHGENPDDEGTIWFEDTGAEEKMIEFLEEIPLRAAGPGELMQDSDVRILDLGTGNGHLLFALREAGWQAAMTGIDYSTASIELARQIRASRLQDMDSQDEQQAATISFEVFDIFSDADDHTIAHDFDAVLDKGTFDAISLNSESVRDDGRVGWQVYGECIAKLMRPGAFFIVTSCNWTEAELRKWIEGPQLAFYDNVEYPSFTFGGAKGQSVSTVCFQKAQA